jgi:hypothetical protein
MDIYDSEILSDAATHCERENDTWIEDLGLARQFDRAVDSIHTMLREEGEQYSASEVRSALSVWLKSAAEDLIDDAIYHVLRPSGPGWGRFRAALEQSASALRPDETEVFADEPIPAMVPSGYRPFSPAALKEMIVYFAAKPGGVLKTKLNKLLFYADFLHFKHRQLSLSGATYVHLPFGPVPDRYESFVESLRAEGVLSSINKSVGSFTGESFEASREADLSLLEPGAYQFLEAVHRRFARLSSTQISAMSHHEPGYIETKPQEIISYSFANRMKAQIPPLKGKW